MGGSPSNHWNRNMHPEDFPTPGSYSKFDPMLGFPDGRKKREMKATWEEMEYFNLPYKERGFCAHTRIAFMKCSANHVLPMQAWGCAHERHAIEECVYDEYILRLKEWERERRLIQRAKRIDARQAKEQAEGGEALTA